MNDMSTKGKRAQRSPGARDLTRFVLSLFGPETQNPLWGTRILPKEPREHVYHYTTIEGVKGILESKTIWATDLRYLNDATEFTHSGSLVEQMITSTLVDPLWKYLPPLSADLRTTHRVGVYAACFRGKPNLLSQWRAYAPQTTGYAIQFNWPHLKSALSCGTNLVTTGRVEYDTDRQREILGQLIRAYAIAHQENDTTTEQATTPLKDAHRIVQYIRSSEDRYRNALAALFIIRAFLKSSAFSEEEEWRAVAVEPNTDDVNFRCSRHMLVPYLSLDFSSAQPLPIDQIIIGPGPHPAEARASLEQFLTRKPGLEHITVEAPTHPLRV